MKIFYLVNLFILSLSFSVKAQQNSLGLGGAFQTFSNVPVEPEHIGLALTFENKMSKHFSSGVLAGFFPKKLTDQDRALKYSRTLITFQPEIRFYLKEVFRGFFIGGNISYNHFSENYSKLHGPSPDFISTPKNYLGFGFSLGFQSKISEKILWGIQASGSLVPNPGVVGSGSRFLAGTNFSYLLGKTKK
jgi:hypothetical protein